MAEFWSLTPRETLLAIRAAEDREEKVREQLAWASWHMAALSRAKRIPPFRQFYRRPAQRVGPAELARRRSDHERMAQAYQGQREEQVDA